MQKKMERMSITIDRDTREKLEELCDQKKLSMSAYLRMMVIQEHDRLEAFPSGVLDQRNSGRAN